MNFVFSILIAIIIILLFAILAAWLGRFGWKNKLEFILKTLERKEAFIDKSIENVLDKIHTAVTSDIDMAMDQHKTGPWFLVVYTQEANLPIWISNNNIRSVHPDLKNCKLIIKQFNGEDMVIENVENYEMRAANKLFDYDM